MSLVLPVPGSVTRFGFDLTVHLKRRFHDAVFGCDNPELLSANSVNKFVY